MNSGVKKSENEMSMQVDKELIGGIPDVYLKIREATSNLKFNMASDLGTGSLLKTLAASKPAGRFLELGTGTGLATAWIAEGLDKKSSLLTIEKNEILIDIARKYIEDKKVEFVLADAYAWINNYRGEKFDFIFADAMPGKYDLFEETIAILKEGGLYIIDDMLPQPNWPLGHEEKVFELINKIEDRQDLFMTRINWSTGIVVVTKKSNN
ncbi:MAG: O-methyltransferase [Chitinophagaceae bacterium]